VIDQGGQTSAARRHDPRGQLLERIPVLRSSWQSTSRCPATAGRAAHGPWWRRPPSSTTTSGVIPRPIRASWSGATSTPSLRHRPVDDGPVPAARDRL